MTALTRIICCLSPNLEKRIQEGQDNKKIKDFLISLARNFKGLEPHLLLIIPYSFKNYLKTDELKLACAILESGGSQSNIWFVPSYQQKNCQQSNVSHLFQHDYSEITTRKIINIMYKKFIPLILDYECQDMPKTECDACSGKEYCSISLLFTPVDTVKSLEEVKKKFPGLIEDFKQTYTLQLENVTQEQVRLTALLMATMHGVETNKFHYANEIVCTKECLQDMSVLQGDEFKDIAFSMLRSLAFPKRDDKAKRERFSIDWHEHTPKSILDYSIHRCDVVNENQSGKKGESGPRRTIIAQLGDKKYFIAYDPTHSVKPEILLERVKKLPKKA